MFDPFGFTSESLDDTLKNKVYQGQKAPDYFTPQADFTGGANQQAQASQSQLLDRLNQQSMGHGPSLATQQLKAASDQNIKNQAAMAAGNRGNPMAAYNATQAAGSTTQNLANSAAQARTQEELNAQAAQAALAGQMQAQSYQGAGMKNAQDLANAQLNQQGNIAFNNMVAQQVSPLEQQQQDQQAKAQKFFSQGLMNGIGGVAGLFAGSDVNMKKNVRPGGHSLHDFLDELNAHEYEYKNPSQPGAAPGTHVSVMAQELEKSPAGSVAVVQAPHGKMVDYKKLLPAMLAAAADAHARLKNLEKTDAR